MTTTLSIGSFNANDRVNTFLKSMKLGKPLRQAAEYGGTGVDIAVPGALDTSAWVESRFQIVIQDTSVDAVAGRVVTLSRELEDLSPITFQLDGSAHPGTLIPVVSEYIEVPLEAPNNALLLSTHWTRIEIIIKREPWVYGPEQFVVQDYDHLCPYVIDISAMKGVTPAPINLQVDVEALELTSFYAGCYPEANPALVDFLRETHDLSWSGGGSGTDTYAYPGSGSYNSNNSATAVYADIEVTDFEHGEYHVFVRAQKTAGTVYVKQAFGDYVSITTTTWDLYHLGVVTLPTSAVHGAAASYLRVYLKGDGTNYVRANYFFFVPASFGGTVGWKASSGHAHVLLWEDDVVYRDSAGCVGEAFGERRMRARQGSIIVCGEVASHAAFFEAIYDVYVDPRYELLTT